MMKLSSDISIFSRVTLLDKVFFTKHLSVMLKSGVPLLTSIQTILSQSTNPAFRDVLKELAKDVSDGSSLEEALRKHPKVFGPLYLNLIKVGEKSGNLEKNLEFLASQLKKEYEFRNKVSGAMLYPEIVLGTISVIGVFISIFVLPKLVDLFASLDIKLPISTRIILFVGRTMRDFGILIVGFFIGLVVLARILATMPAVKPFYHRMLLSMPVFGVFLQNIELASFTRNLGIMLKSGLPLSVALQTEYESTENRVYKEYIKALSLGIQDGRTLESVLSAPDFKFMPKIMVKMIGIGEKTGKLDESLTYLGDFFEDEVDNTSKNLGNVLEPLLLVIIGLVVAFVAFSIISPIYEFTGSIKR